MLALQERRTVHLCFPCRAMLSLARWHSENDQKHVSTSAFSRVCLDESEACLHSSYEGMVLPA
jgi:hypothetical protein